MSKTQVLRESRLLWRVSSNLAVAGTINVFGPSAGYRRLVGNLVLAAGMTLSVARVRWSLDGTNFGPARTLNLDPTQAVPTYTWDMIVEGPYVAIEFTNSGAAGNVAGYATLVPGGA